MLDYNRFQNKEELDIIIKHYFNNLYESKISYTSNNEFLLKINKIRFKGHREIYSMIRSDGDLREELEFKFKSKVTDSDIKSFISVFKPLLFNRLYKEYIIIESVVNKDPDVYMTIDSNFSLDFNPAGTITGTIIYEICHPDFTIFINYSSGSTLQNISIEFLNEEDQIEKTIFQVKNLDDYGDLFSAILKELTKGLDFYEIKDNIKSEEFHDFLVKNFSHIGTLNNLISY